MRPTGHCVPLRAEGRRQTHGPEWGAVCEALRTEAPTFMMISSMVRMSSPEQAPSVTYANWCSFGG